MKNLNSVGIGIEGLVKGSGCGVLAMTSFLGKSVPVPVLTLAMWEIKLGWAITLWIWALMVAWSSLT